MSVVDGVEWERLKRYNLHEIYKGAVEDKKTGEVKSGEEKTENGEKAGAA